MVINTNQLVIRESYCNNEFKMMYYIMKYINEYVIDFALMVKM